MQHSRQGSAPGRAWRAAARASAARRHEDCVHSSKSSMSSCAGLAKTVRPDFGKATRLKPRKSVALAVLAPNRATATATASDRDRDSGFEVIGSRPGLESKASTKGKRARRPALSQGWLVLQNLSVAPREKTRPTTSYHCGKVFPLLVDVVPALAPTNGGSRSVALLMARFRRRFLVACQAKFRST